jgi:hypothetical protein
MRELSEIQVANYYVQLMEHVKWRMVAAQEIMADIHTNPGHPGLILNFELCTLQIRKICEALAIAVLVAHQLLDEATTNRFRDKWNADQLLGLLDQVNENSFPMKVKRRDQISKGIDHHFQIIRESVLTKRQLRTIYSRCGELLHVGSLAGLLKGKRPEFRTRELEQWMKSLADLLQTHVIALPEFERLLFCSMTDPETGKAQVAISRAGPAQESA